MNRADRIYQLWVDAGASPQLAAMMVGIAKGESDFDPTTVGDGGTSFGIYQVGKQLGHKGRNLGAAGQTRLYIKNLQRNSQLWNQVNNPDASFDDIFDAFKKTGPQGFAFGEGTRRAAKRFGMNYMHASSRQPGPTGIPVEPPHLPGTENPAPNETMLPEPIYDQWLGGNIPGGFGGNQMDFWGTMPPANPMPNDVMYPSPITSPSNPAPNDFQHPNPIVTVPNPPPGESMFPNPIVNFGHPEGGLSNPAPNESMFPDWPANYFTGDNDFGGGGSGGGGQGRGNQYSGPKLSDRPTGAPVDLPGNGGFNWRNLLDTLFPEDMGGFGQPAGYFGVPSQNPQGMFGVGGPTMPGGGGSYFYGSTSFNQPLFPSYPGGQPTQVLRSSVPAPGGWGGDYGGGAVVHPAALGAGGGRTGAGIYGQYLTGWGQGGLHGAAGSGTEFGPLRYR